MDFLSEHYLDIITVLLIIIITYSGYKKGILQMVISLAGFFISAAVAGFVSNVTYEYVYFHIVQPSVMEYIEAEADKLSEEYSQEKLLEKFGVSLPDSEFTADEEMPDLTNEEISGKLNSIFKEYCGRITASLSGVIPDEILESADKYLEKNELDKEAALNYPNNMKASAATLIESEIVRPVMLKTVKNIIFFITFTVICIVFSIILRAVKVIRKIELIKKPDSFFGGILGFVYSILTIMAISLLCSIFIKLTANENSVLNTSVIEKTYIFKYTYSSSFLLLTALFK
ncbi:MAG: hypothetical protein ACI4YB_10810 [Oscillospiraceae bacterium]